MKAKHFSIGVAFLFALSMAFHACQQKRSHMYEKNLMTQYQATPYETDVEWVVNFKDTAQMALTCETVYISVAKAEGGKLRLSLKSKRSAGNISPY